MTGGDRIARDSREENEEEEPVELRGGNCREAVDLQPEPRDG